jgi:hypothetical protein
LPFGSRVTADCGTRNASVSIDWAKRAFTNIPGNKMFCELGKRALSVTAPVSGLTMTSLNWTVPV